MPHLKPWVVLAALCHCAFAAAQSGYPARPVSLVVPFAADGPNDAEFRLLLPQLQEATKKSFVFDFRPGAGSTIGTAYAAKAVPDGCTLLLTSGSITLLPNFYPDLSYDVARSFEPVIQLTERYTVLVASTEALPRVHNVQDLIAYGKANPGILNCGTAGSGSIGHITCVALASAIGVPIASIHYKGVSQVLTDLIGGRTHLTAGTLLVAQPAIKAGKARAIVALNTERSKTYPEVKTAIELGLDVEYPTWLGVFAPAGTAAGILGRLNREMASAARQPEVMSKLEAQGTYIVAGSPEAFRKKVLSELARWKKIIQEKNIRLDE